VDQSEFITYYLGKKTLSNGMPLGHMEETYFKYPKQSASDKTIQFSSMG